MTTIAHSQQMAELFESHGLHAVVALQLADQTGAPITIWPYAVDFNPSLRNQPPARSPTGETIDPSYAQRTHALVLPSSLSAYDQARAIILRNPVLRQSESQTHIEIEVLSLAEMAALFSASGVNFRVVLAVAIQ